MPARHLNERERHTSLFIWAAAILCTIIAIAVIITGIVVIVIYIIYQPKMPYLFIQSAQLVQLQYDQSGTLETELTITITARNDNRHADATFSGLAFSLVFHDTEIAQLRADDFNVPKNSSFPLAYDVQSSPIPLDEGAMQVMDAALRNGEVPFVLIGRARTRWRLGVLLSVGFSAHVSCQMEFFWPNGSVVHNLDCSSKSR